MKCSQTQRLVMLLALLALAGCSREGKETLPAGCREGTAAVREALKAAPGEVRVSGAPLSACLGDESDSGELRDVGTAYLDAAASLSSAATKNPDGPEATQLGYLMGAVRRTESAEQGVNYEMVRRLEQELLPVDTESEAFKRGEEAGRRGG